MAGRFSDEFIIGEIIEHAVRRTVTETDNLLITTLTMNPASLHLDHHAAEQTEFGRVLVNSLFTLGLVVGLSVGDTTLGTAIGNLGFEEVRFPAPVFVGDTLRARTEVLAARSSRSRPGQGIVTFLHEGYNQDDRLVCRCRRMALLWKKTADRGA